MLSFEEWNNLFQSVGAVATAISLFFLVRQLNLQKREMNINLEYQKREKAIEMCKFYENLLSDITHISYLYQKYWRNFKMEKKIVMKDFTKEEFLEYFTEDMIKEMTWIPYNFLIKDFFERSANNQVKYLDIYSEFKKRDFNIYSDDDFKKMKKEEIEKKNLLNIKLQVLGDNLFKETTKKYESVVNKLEYFSMNFMCGIADESIVYQSLHQSFFGVISFFYPKICSANSGTGKDKYYTNLINLYNLWKEREEKYKKEEKNLEQNYHSNKSNYL